MEAFQNKRWLVILFFLVMGLLMMAIIYAAIVGPRGYQQRMKRYSPTKVTRPVKAAAAGQETFVLLLNRVESVGNIKLIYRGRDQGRVTIDVIIPALDPKSVYTHDVPVKQAKQGMRLGGARFKLTDISKSKIQLESIQ